MKNIGIVCEYNPFHNGHAKQIGMFDRTVCLMSGNFVQRGEPAIVDKYVRARAAVECGASLVLELPITCAIASAEGFADGAVEIFDRLGCVDGICFGSEDGKLENIMSTAKALLDPKFSEHLRVELDKGASFPTARANALTAMGAMAIEKPNDILAVEYCKALLRRESSIEPIAILREGDYHGGSEQENPSASFLRTTDDWQNFMPENALRVFENAPRYSLGAGERAVLARLRAMTEAEFETLPYGSEGLWRKLMHACRRESNLEAIIQAVKSKRYTRTRIMRMILCAYLGITEEMMQRKPPYVRVLAFDEHGSKILRAMRTLGTIQIVNAGEIPSDTTYWEIERLASDLYGLFSNEIVAKPMAEHESRIFYRKIEKNTCNS